VWHQCGRANSEKVAEAYRDSGVPCRVDEFIEDMAVAYTWSDMVICRAGAMTVSEVCVAGVVALFIPYPYAVNDHQTRNAEYLVSGGAALACDQPRFIKGAWISQLANLGTNRGALTDMAKKARNLARMDATEQVADICEALIHA
jgi:UDP-N-acetylglucosamine--N-acetylmuramyl-(pentapeptide) pyrophosphoryl-undecaprenol N-acetylglucosamine transferase